MRPFCQFFASVILVGCGSSRPAVQSSGGLPQDAAPALAASGAAGTAASAERERRPPAGFTLVEAPIAVSPLPAPKLELVRPSAGETIAASAARSYPLEIQLSSFIATAKGQGVLVSLDGRRARRWQPGLSLELGHLILEDEELSPGAHTLFGFLVDADGRVLRASSTAESALLFQVEFFVETARAPQLDSEPQLVCVAPVGTYYGSENDALRVEVLAPPSVNSVELHFQGDGAQWVTSIDPRRAFSARGLPLGDWRVVASSAGERSWPCELTLNPELPGRPR